MACIKNVCLQSANGLLITSWHPGMTLIHFPCQSWQLWNVHPSPRSTRSNLPWLGPPTPLPFEWQGSLSSLWPSDPCTTWSVCVVIPSANDHVLTGLWAPNNCCAALCHRPRQLVRRGRRSGSRWVRLDSIDTLRTPDSQTLFFSRQDYNSHPANFYPHWFQHPASCLIEDQTTSHWNPTSFPGKWK
jgi:hypothetical protein